MAVVVNLFPIRMANKAKEREGGFYLARVNKRLPLSPSHWDRSSKMSLHPLNLVKGLKCKVRSRACYTAHYTGHVLSFY